MVDENEIARCQHRAELHLARAAKAASKVARVANLDMAAIFATRCERLRRSGTAPSRTES
jgi:hypothetical protein